MMQEPRTPNHFRVAMVAACPLPQPRGTPIRIHRLANALAERGHEVHVVAYHLGNAESEIRYRLHRIPPIPTYRKVAPGPTWQKLLVLDPLLALTLRRLLTRIEAQVIHAHHFEGLLAALAANRRFRLPVVFDAHTLLQSELPYYRMGLTRRTRDRLAFWLDRKLPGRADHVIAVSPLIRTRLIQSGAVGPEQISVIPNGVQSELFEATRTVPGDAQPGHTAVFAGNLAAYQGIDLMLRAFAELAKRHGEARLLIVTEGDFAPYAALSGQLGVQDRIQVSRATFEELPAQLASADIALNPRIGADGLPQKLLNYMAAGKPIVSFAGSANMLVHERDALIVPDGDIAGFAEAMHRLFQDRSLAQRLGQSARAASESLTWSATAERVESVYHRVLSARHG